jgi:hypothetical protein
MGRWKNRPEGSNWGDFGPDDQIGRLNLLTPEKVLQGIAEVREGRSFCLSLPLDLPGGNLLNNARHAPQRFATRTPDGTDRYLLRLGDVNPDFFDVVNDDRVIIHTQYSTQWDSLAHVGAEFDADGDGVAEQVFYNGWRGGEHIAPGAPCEDCGDLTGVEAKRLGIETIAETCVQGRAVMIDLHAIHGDAHVDVDFAGLAEAMGMSLWKPVTWWSFIPDLHGKSARWADRPTRKPCMVPAPRWKGMTRCFRNGCATAARWR